MALVPQWRRNPTTLLRGPTVWDRYRSPNQDHRPGFGFDGFEIRPQAAVLIRCAFRWLQNSFRTIEAAEVHVLVQQSWQLFGITRDASICSLPGCDSRPSCFGCTSAIFRRACRRHPCEAIDSVWFCLKTQPKREHLAATALRRQFGVECFSPRVRFRRMTQRGPVEFVEAMFPGYLFARIYSTQHRAILSSHRISGIVHFGDRLATLPENIVAALQSSVGAEEVVTLDYSIKVGRSVEIIEGPFQDWRWLLICCPRKNGHASYSISSGDLSKWRSRR